ncbi:MAG: iron-containing alcohol dehydrogenase [Elusimicrobiota bacterium]|nr:iron-containing alcohol dehydrogenase [Elusimicrobiota bacterium]
MDFLQDNSFIGKGSINKLQEVIANSKNILIFTGNTIFEKIKDITVPLLKGKNIDFYNDFSTNPNILELQKALNSINKNYDTIIAVGGGSVIDFAKLYKYETKSNAFFIAIPTTAGSGSQATKFAVCFVDGKKKSIESDNLLPNIAIVDPQFLKDSPRYLKACCAFDALSQSIESFWSIYSTPLSRKYALASLELCKDNIVSFVNSEDEKSAYNMALAAHLSGKAINISKTTVAHALSYVFNVKYNIAHGHAVALSFARAFEANVNIAPQDLLDKRGADFYKNISNTLKSMFNKDYFRNLFMQIGLETNLTKLGIKNISDLVKEVNLERLSNNPRKFTFKELENLFFI